jgi:competence protein ComEC
MRDMPESFGIASPPTRSGPFAALLGWVLGTALQLQQAALWPAWAYGLPLLAGLLGAVGLGRRQGVLGWLFCAAALAFASTGLRSLAFDGQALNPALEGRELRVVGVVTDMPQRNEAGLRFTLATESATLQGQATAVPATIDVGWYAGSFSMGGESVSLQRQPGDVRAGERWSLTLRLKAPHGSRNPFGFDFELWLWQRGVQATAYVRAGSHDAEPQRLGQTGWHPVALLRQSVRDRILAHGEQQQASGLIAALVVGDQAAIDRWWLTLKFCSGTSLIYKAFRLFKTFAVTLKFCSSRN